MANRIEIQVTASKRGNLKSIGQQFKKELDGAVGTAMKDADRDVTTGMRRAGKDGARAFGSENEKIVGSARDTGRRAGGQFVAGYRRQMQAQLGALVQTTAKNAGQRAVTQMKTAGRDAGAGFSRQFGGRFTRDIGGRLHGLRGRVVHEGAQLGGDMGHGMVRTLGKRLVLGAANAAMTAGREAAATFTSALQGGLKSPVVGPIIVGALSAAIAIGAPVLGALLASGIVLAFGAGIAGLGLAATFGLKSVKKRFKGFKKYAKSWAHDVFAPFKSSWKTAFDVGERTLAKMKGAFSKSSKIIAPSLNKFIRNLGKAFAQLGPALPPISRAFSKLLDALGPMLPGIFKSLAHQLTALANTISKNPKMFAGLIADVIKLLPLAVKLIGDLAKLATKLDKIGGLGDPFASIADGAISALSPVAALTAMIAKAQKLSKPASEKLGGQAANSAMGLVDAASKGVPKRSFTKGGKIKVGVADHASGPLAKIKAKVKSLVGPKVWSFAVKAKNQATKVINRVKRDAKGFAKGVYRAALKAANKVKGTVAKAKKMARGFAHGVYRAILRAKNNIKGTVANARKMARRFAHATYRAVLRARNNVAGAVSRARNACRRFARATYRALLSARNAVWSALRSALAAGRNWASRVFTATFNVAKNFLGFEHGGVVGGGKATGGVAGGGRPRGGGGAGGMVARAASGGNRGSSVLVGEHGPELAQLPGGSRIRSNSDTRRIMSGVAQSASGPIVIQLSIAGSDLGEIVVDPLRKTVRKRGGNVQAVLGSR